MTRSDFKAFGHLMARASVVFDADVSASKIDIYAQELQDLSLEDVSRAMQTCIRTQKWFPRIAEIRQAALPVETLTAFEAWTEVQGLMRSYRGSPATFSSPRVEEACAAVGGLRTLTLASMDQEGMHRAHFTKAYDSLGARQAKQALIGREDAATVLRDLYKQIEEQRT